MLVHDLATQLAPTTRLATPTTHPEQSISLVSDSHQLQATFQWLALIVAALVNEGKRHLLAQPLCRCCTKIARR